MRLASKAAAVLMATVAAVGGSAATATAATAKPAAAASCGWGDPLGASYYDPTTATDPEYWLSYNSCTGVARGGIIVHKLWSAGNWGWHLWVYNEDTKAQKNLYFPHYDAPGQTFYTDTVGTSGTRSHVCLQQYNLSTKAGLGAKYCTGYYEGEVIVLRSPARQSAGVSPRVGTESPNRDFAVNKKLTVNDTLLLVRGLTLNRQTAWPLASLLPIAAISCVRAGSVKVVFACTLTSQLDGCGCPAVTDGLDGFWPAPDNPAAGAWTTHVHR
jgi:hypothetical protein